MKTKKTLLVILLFGTAVFTNCKKCATCTQTITTSVNVSTPGYPQTSKTTFEACGDDLKAVDGKTTTSTSSSGSITATATSKTVCK
jgi:hypothetical protein